MGELVITTSDKDLLADINAAAIDGVVINKPKIRKASAIITTIPDTSLVKTAIDIGVNFTGGASAALFVKWFTEYLNKKKTEKINNDQIKINGVEVSGKNNDVKTQINNYINCNFYNGKPVKKE